MRSASPPQPTVPSTIAEEHLINPFMRVTHNSLSKYSSFLKMSVISQVTEPKVQAHAGKSEPVDTMRALRAEKDNFKSK